MAAVFTWTSYVDTDLAFSEFFNSDHTLTLRYLTPCSRGYEGPCIAENGRGSFALGQGPYFEPPEGSNEPASTRLYVAVGTEMTAIKIAVEPLKWYHLALVALAGPDGRTFQLYRDGKSIAVLGVPSSTTGLPVGKLRFGKRTTGQTINTRNAQFYGLLADVGVFTRALTAVEIGALAAPGRTLTGDEAGLLAGYPLTPGAKAGKLARPVTLHGPTTTVNTSATGDNTADAKLIPLPTAHQPMDLPFPLGEAWVTGQAWNGAPSHNGLAGFCWDLTVEGATTTDGQELYASAPGEVVAVRETAPSGDSEYANHVDVKQAETEYASYIHLQTNGVTVKKGDTVKLGQKVGLAGDTGTSINNFHLHFAVSDKPDRTEGFVTIPIAFSDYEVRSADGLWKPVARGVPQEGDVIRNPPTPEFHRLSLGPQSVVSRGSNLLDLIASDAEGKVWIARWTPNRYARNWDRWRRVLSDIGSPRPIGVVSRSPSRLDIVAANGSGAIYTGGWNEHSINGVWGGWWRIKVHVAKANAPVSIAARDSGKLDVFSVRNDGAVSTAAWDHDVADGAWRGWWSVAGGETVPGGWVTAVSRAPDKLDVFMVGKDGGVYTAAWERGVENGAWRGWWRVRNMVSTPGAYVAAVARDPDKLDIFVVRTDGAVSTAAWDRKVANGAWRGWWSVAGGATTVLTPITAVSRHPNKLDVFMVGKDGGVYTAAWELGVENGAWRGWWRVKDLVAFSSSAVAAVARDPDKLDIFAVRTDGEMSTAAWDQNLAEGAWRGWWRIGVERSRATRT